MRSKGGEDCSVCMFVCPMPSDAQRSLLMVMGFDCVQDKHLYLRASRCQRDITADRVFVLHMVDLASILGTVLDSPKAIRSIP